MGASAGAGQAECFCDRVGQVSGQRGLRDARSRTASRSHEVTKSRSHDYSLSLFPDQGIEAAEHGHEEGLQLVDDLARRLGALLPPGMAEARVDLEKNFRAALQSGLQRLDLVTREEFEVQRAVLLRTREKLDALERALAQRADTPTH